MTYNENSKWYYFPNDDFCDYYFSEDSIYDPRYNGLELLQRLFNEIVGHSTNPEESRTYFTVTNSVEMHYWEYPELINYPPYYRLYYTNGYFYTPLTKDEMCYYLDSYIGLGKQFEGNYADYRIVKGTITCQICDMPDNSREPDSENTGTLYPQWQSHIFTVYYGRQVLTPTPPIIEQ